jgi:uncharacterized protein
MLRTFAAACAAVVLLHGAASAQSPPLVDHHQHLFSPWLAALLSEPYPAPPFNPITADDVIAHLDAAGIARAVVLSTAYVWSQPWRAIDDQHAQARRDNDWASQQVSRYPDRLIGFCAIHPTASWALEEIARCARDPYLRQGIKLHVGSSATDYRNPEHVAQLRRVFRAVNEQRMPLIVHMRTSGVLQVPYGGWAARAFLDELVTAAPDIPIQIAHLAGSGGYNDPAVDESLAVFAEAIGRGDPRTDRLWFDVSGVAMAPLPRLRAQLLATRIRQLGVQRILYGSDAAVVRNTPHEAWAAFRRLPLTDEEFRTIASNVAPYLR